MTVTNTYADVEHVQPYVTPYGLTIGTTSKPTTTQVEGFLDQTAAEVDAALKTRGYGTIPATDTTDILFLRGYVSRYAAVLTYIAGFGADNMPDGIKEFAATFRTFLSDLKSGKVKLPAQSARARIGSVKPMRYIED